MRPHYVYPVLLEGLGEGRLYSSPLGITWKDTLCKSNILCYPICAGSFGAVATIDHPLLEDYVVKHIGDRPAAYTNAKWQAVKASRERALRNEADMLAHAARKGSRYAVRIKALVELEHTGIIVMENAGTKSLADVNVRNVSYPVLTDVIGQVTSAVIDLYRIGLFHGDLKATNIVITPRDITGQKLQDESSPGFHHITVKLVDFGGAQLSDQARTTPPIGSMGLGVEPP